MKKHRWLAWLLSIAMLLSMLPMSAMAQEADTMGEQSEQTDTSDVPTEEQTEEPTEAPTEEPTEAPTEEPTEAPTEEPTEAPTEEPTEAPNREPRRDGSWTGTYLDCDENGKNWVTKTCTEGATVLTSSVTAWNTGWYVVNSDVTLTSNVTVTGDVKLILADGASLTTEYRIAVTEGNSLTIYAQSTGDNMGKLTGKKIGANNGRDGKGGTLVFNGGRLTFSGGTPVDLCEGALIINGGYIESSSNSDTAVGASDWDYKMGTVTINGGTLIATTTDESDTAIGQYWNQTSGNATLNVNGGTLVLSSPYGAVATGVVQVNLNEDYNCRITAGSTAAAAELKVFSARTLSLWGGNYIKVEPCESHTPISGVVYRNAQSHIVDGCRLCGGGTAQAHSYDAETNLCACGAWAGSYLVCDENGKNWKTEEASGITPLTELGGLHKGGTYVLLGECSFSDADTYPIREDVTLILADGANATFTGGLRVDGSGSLTIYAQSAGDNMGKLTAKGAYLQAGIGGNHNDAVGPIKIYGGEINAKGATECAGIGGGAYGGGGDLKIYGGKVNATGGYYAPGIGGGANYEGTNAGGTVTIYGGTVMAYGSIGACSIGSGYCYISTGTRPRYTGGSGGTLNLNGGTLYLLKTEDTVPETDACYRTPRALEGAPNFSTEVGWLQSFGTNASDLVQINAVDLTGEEYVTYAAAKFESCSHDPNASAQYIDEQNHAASCTWCGMTTGSMAAHNFGENGLCACGAWKTTVLDCDENGENWTTKTVVGINRLEAPESGTVVTLKEGWYIAADDLKLCDENTDFTIRLNGDVKLILCDGKSIELNGTIESTDANNTLTVYGQSAGDGKGALVVNGRIDSDLVVNGGSVLVNKPDGFAAVGEDETLYGPFNGSFTLVGGAVTVSAMNEGVVLPKFVPTMKNGAGLKFSGGATADELSVVTANDFADLTDYRAYPTVRFEVCTDHKADADNVSYPVKVDNAHHKNICEWCGNEYLADHEYDEVGLCDCGAGSVNYRVYNETSKKWEQKQCNEFTFVTGETQVWEAGWYVVAGSVVITSDVFMTGDVHIILRDNASLNVRKGITCQLPNSTLTIYAQSAPSIGEDGSISNGNVGTLTVRGSDAALQYGGYGITSYDDDLTLAVMGGILDIRGTYNAINCKLYAYGGRITARVGSNEKSAFGETPELCGDAGWVVRNGGDIDYVTAVEHSKLTAESYQTSAVALDPCGTHEYSGEYIYVDNTRHGRACKWCGTMGYESHAYEEVSPGGNYLAYYEPCTCGAWKGKYDDDFVSDSTVTISAEGVRPLTAKDTVWTEGIYAVCGDVTFDSRVTVSGNVTIVLTRTANLIVNGGIEVNDNSDVEGLNTNSLTVFKDYSSYQNISKLTVQNVPEQCAGIGGGNGKTAGTIRLGEGYYDITGGAGAPGVGGGYGGGTGKITLAAIKSAVIRGGTGAVGIGAGNTGTPNAVTILKNSDSLIVSGETAFDIAPVFGGQTFWLTISAGSSEATLTRQMKKDGVAALTTAGAIKMEMCDHDAAGIQYSYVDTTYHYWYCGYCEDRGAQDPHTYDETTHACVCGRWTNGNDTAFVWKPGESLNPNDTYIVLEDITLGTPEEPVTFELKNKLILGDGVTLTVNGSIMAYDSEITALSYGENMGKLIVQNVPDSTLGIEVASNSTLTVSGGDIMATAGACSYAIGTESDQATFVYTGGRVTAQALEETNGWSPYCIDPTINVPYRLYAGATVDSLELVTLPYRDDFDFHLGAMVVRLDEPCDFHVYNVYYYKDRDYHTAACYKCGSGSEEIHFYGEGNVCVCGRAAGVNYLDYDIYNEKWATECYTGEATLITQHTTKLNTEWCIVRGDVTIGSESNPVKIPVNQSARLILVDGANLTIYGYLLLGDDVDTFDVYAQSTGSSMGKLTIKAPKNRAAIGGKCCTAPHEHTFPDDICITIYGGELDLTGGSNMPAICGGEPYSYKEDSSFTLYVCGGKTTARGGSGKEAVGHSCYTYVHRSYDFTIYGGEFTAIGGEGACAFADGTNYTASVSDGTLTAEGGSGKAAFAVSPNIWYDNVSISVGNSIANLTHPIDPNGNNIDALCTEWTAVRLEQCTEHKYGPVYSDQSTHSSMCLNCMKLQESGIAHTFDEETGLCGCGAWKGTYRTYDPETATWSTSEPVVARSVESTDYQWNDGWYVVRGDVTIDQRMIISGHVRLILTDDSSLTVNGGISLIRNHTLTIYAQSEGEHMGSLTAQNVPEDCAGIGGNECLGEDTHFIYGPDNGGMYSSTGDLNIYGGRITATGGGWATGIGDGACYEVGDKAKSGDITIYGGVITATGGGNASGIGYKTFVDWSNVQEGAKITVYGGTVNAYGGSHKVSNYGSTYVPGTGIGGFDMESLTVYGGTVNAYGGVNHNGTVAPAAGIGTIGATEKAMSVIIKGGKITAVSGEGGSAYNANLTLSEECDWMVYAGTTEDDLSLVAPADRTDALYTSNQAVRITGCADHQITAAYDDTTQHRSVCSLCGMTTYAAHTFNEETGLCICGGWQGTYRTYDAESESWSTSEPVVARSVTAEDTQWAEGWMVVTGNVTIDRRVVVSGDVKLILTDNSSLTVNGGIAVTYPNTLTIYAQSEGEQMGSLTAQTTESGFAAIGGNAAPAEESAADESVLYSGSIIVHGGAINATGNAENGGGIGDGSVTPTDETLLRAITVYGGAVNASGACGIGVLNGNIYYYGGVITASGESPLMYAPTVYVDTWCVYSGASASDLTLMQKDDVTDQTYTDSACIKIALCEQHDGGMSYKDPTGHFVGCNYCGESILLPHAFENGTCECGAICTTYLECDADGKNWNTVTNAGVLPYNVSTDAEYPSLTDGWYLVTGTWNYGTAEYSAYSNRITILGDVKLILADGASLNAYAGIEVPENSTLTIYAQSKNDAMGTLTAYSPGSEVPAIGAERANTGTINIKGGSITADGSASRGSGTGIGAYKRYGATINIYDGVINATGSSDNPAIGGGGETTEKALNVTIYGGKVTANGKDRSAGIGTGWNSSSQKLWVCGGITINGGVVNATGGELAAGIGGGYWTGSLPVTINGGTVTATGGTNGVGIGDGCDYDVSDRKTTITINGGKVTANGGTWANAIGDNLDDGAANRVVININGGEIIAVAGSAFDEESPTYAFSVEPTRNLSGYLYSAGASLEALASIALSDLSTPFCTQNAAVKMVPCTHPDGYSENVAFTDDETHTAGCAYCGENAAVDHSFPAESNGFCTVCNAYQPAVLNTDGYYEIGNAGQFLWFSRKINNGERTINGKLIADISLKDIDLAPISGVYSGIFDGDEHTISDIALAASSGAFGLFTGLGTNGVLKNFTLRGEITCNAKIEMLGSVVGYINGAGTIDNVHSYVNISGNGTAYEGTQYIGGIVGYTAHTEEASVVKNCTYRGTIDLPYAARTGGICGYAGSNSQTLACVNYGTVKVGGGYHTGGILGAGQKTLVERCMNYGTVEMKSHDCLGGIVGYATDSTRIKSCGNVGSVTGTSTSTGAPDAYVGGILGYINSSAFGELSNCYNYGTITAYAQNTYCGAIIGWGRSGATQAKIINNYYLSGEDVKAFGTINDTTATATAVSAEQFASGEVAYLLNGQVTDGTQAWYQELTDADKKDAYPVISGKTVYYGYRDCRDEAMLYSNTPSTLTKSEHNYDNGFCTVCDAYQPAVLNTDGYYEIGNAGQLYWFAGLVNGTLTGVSKENSAWGKLIADITVNKNVIVNGELSSKSATFRTWTPIGVYNANYRNAYTGTFDGNNKTISGLYYASADNDNIGLFGVLSMGTIRDLSVKDTYFGAKWSVGGIAGNLTPYWGSITVTNCSFDGMIVSLLDRYTSTAFGGIVGYAYAVGRNALTIENCSSSAVVRNKSSRVGGVVGKIYSENEADCIVRNCYFTGKTEASQYNGGIVGEVETRNDIGILPQIIKCYNLGSITVSSDGGGVIGSAMDTKVIDCYNLGSITVSSDDGGGVIGSGTNVTLTRCYNAGSVTAKNKYVYSVGALVGKASLMIFENCYYLEGSAHDGQNVVQCAVGNETVGSFTPDEEGIQTTAMSADQFASGEVTWLLNDQTAEATEDNPLTWYQTLGTDTSPRFTGGTVYLMTNTGCPNAPARYSNTANETYVGAHDYGEDGFCACGATVQTILTFEKSLSLQSYVAFNFLVKKDALNDLDDWYMVITRDDAEKGPQTETINGVTHRDNIVRFEYKIFSYQMADKLTVTIYGVKDGVTFAGETYTASVADYCMTKIAAADDGMKSIYANLLTYGAKAQLYSGYRADEPADSVLGEYASFVTSTVPSVENKSAAASNDVTNLVSLRANAVGIASSVQLQFILTPAEGFDPANVYAEVKWMDDGVESVKQIEGTSFVSNLAGTTYTVVFEDLRADEGRSLVSVTIRDKETDAAVSDTWTFSIESYVAMRQSSANTNLVTMLNALMNYYDAAEAYYGR